MNLNHEGAKTKGRKFILADDRSVALCGRRPCRPGVSFHCSSCLSRSCLTNDMASSFVEISSLSLRVADGVEDPSEELARPETHRDQIGSADERRRVKPGGGRLTQELLAVHHGGQVAVSGQRVDAPNSIRSHALGWTKSRFSSARDFVLEVLTSAICCNSQPTVSTSSFDIRNRLQILQLRKLRGGQSEQQRGRRQFECGPVQQLQSPEGARPLGARVIGPTGAKHRRQLGDDLREKSKLPRQFHRPPAVRVDEHLPAAPA